MTAPQSTTETTAEATSEDAVSATDAGETALPDADAASADAVVESAEVVETSTGDDDGDDDEDEDEDDLLVQEGDVAGDYLERLLDILDVDGDIDLDVEGDRASVAVVGGELEATLARAAGFAAGLLGHDDHPPRQR